MPATTPGVLVSCANLAPTKYGLEQHGGNFSAVFGVGDGPTTVNPPLGFAMIGDSPSTNRILFATDDTIYERDDGTNTWIDVSRVSGYAITSTQLSTQWSFAQFGSSTLAANVETTMQLSTAPLADFANISGAPKASIIESIVSSGGGFVMAFNTDDGTYGVSPDRWWCCAANDATDWTPSIATQCATGRLLGNEGPILAGKKFGNDMVVAYKDAALYVGRYVGGDAVWLWQEYPGFGCVGPDAVTNLGTAHFVVDKNGPYIFDGNRPVRIGDEISFTHRESFNGSLGAAVPIGQNKVLYDRRAGRVWWFLPGVNRAYRTRYTLAYHLESGMWGRADGEVGPVTIMNHDDTVSTIYNGIYGLFSSGGGSVDYKLGQFGAYSGSTTFRTNWFGDDLSMSMLTECQLRFDDSQPAVASVQAYYKNIVDATGNTGPAVSNTDSPTTFNMGRFTLRQTARWHSLEFATVSSLSGAFKIIGFDVKLKSIGGMR